MTVHFTDLALSLTCYLLMWLACTGWGSVAARFLRLGFRRGERPFAHVWLGWAVSLLLVQVWHVFRPVDAMASLWLVGLGAALGVWSSLPMLRGWRRFEAREAIFLCTVLVVAGWVACRGMLAMFEADSGGYHFNMVNWINQYAIVPGLGNLYGRLAYNQSFFLCVALWDFYPFFNHGHNVAASFLFLTLAVECLYVAFAWFRAGRANTHRALADFLPILLLPVVAMFILRSNISSPSPDSPAYPLQFVLLILLVRLLVSGGGGPAATSYAKLIMVLGAAATTVKLSNVAYCFLAATIAVAVCYARRPAGLWRRTAQLSSGGILAAVMLLVWMTRGVIWSGMPLYPLSILRFPVEWAVPAEQARMESRWIFSWARLPEADWKQVLESWDWLKPWAERTITGTPVSVFPLATSAGAFLALLIILACARCDVRRAMRPAAWAVILPVGGLIFWFLTAPDLRFGVGLMWIACVTLALPLAAAAMTLRARPQAFILLAIFLAVNLWPIARVSWWPANEGEVKAGYYAKPIGNFRVATTYWGLEVNVPTGGGSIWDGRLPAAPSLNPYLALRGKDLASGFVIRVPPSPGREAPGETGRK